MNDADSQAGIEFAVEVAAETDAYEDDLEFYYEAEELLLEKGLERTFRQLQRAVYEYALDTEKAHDSNSEDVPAYKGMELWVEEGRVLAGLLISTFAATDEEFAGDTALEFDTLHRVCWAVADILRKEEQGETVFETY
jgi:hypothetical protein